MRVSGGRNMLCNPNFVPKEVGIVVKFHKTTIRIPTIHNKQVFGASVAFGITEIHYTMSFTLIKDTIVGMEHKMNWTMIFEICLVITIRRTIVDHVI